MNRLICLISIIALLVYSTFVGCSQPTKPPDTWEPPELNKGPLIQHVDPFIGTGGPGFSVGSSLPGATAPFGMVKVSPDTASQNRGLNFDHCAGYSYNDKEIFGFSHIHLHGTGLPDYGNLLIMPVTGPIDEKRIKEEGHRSVFKHDTEKASPGYYAVTLERFNIRAELTATTRTAYHRYTFPKDAKERTVILRLDHALPSGDVTDAAFDIKSDKEITGWLHGKGSMSGRGGGYHLYFVLRSKQAFVSGTFKNGKLDAKAKSQKSASIGAYLQYGAKDESVELQVGISFTSVEEARKNLDAESKGWDFEKTRKSTEDAWEKILSVVKVGGGTKKQLRIFYTALYHAFQMPTIFSDVSGSYTGFDKKPHKADGFIYYSDFSLWDTYRTLHPLLVLLTPKREIDMVKSLLRMSKEGGGLPRWPLATGYTGTMVGASADIVIADTYIKGLKDFDVNYAYKMMVEHATKPVPKGAKYPGRGGIEEYMKYGYVTADRSSGTASVTMEYAYNDYTVAQLAKALGKTKDYETFMKRSTNYKHLWDPKTAFFRAKHSDGSWLKGFSPLKWTKDYVEGDAWQYLWFVPHDTKGLSGLFGGNEKLLTKLDTFFEESKKEYDAAPNSPAPRKYYWHGNEPDIHAATIYTELGALAKGQKWIRWIMDTYYKDEPAGLAGNDDAGTLSAWYIFNALGIYPIPGKDLYLITSPIFPRSVIEVAGKKIEIIAKHASPKAIYVKSVKLNGKVISNYQLRHTELVKDGQVLEFEMTEKIAK